jgi:hypothetical protein
MRRLAPIIFIVASAGIFFGFIDGQYEEVKALSAQRAEYERVLGQSKELLRRRAELQDSYSQISPAQTERLRKLVPDTVDNVRLILDIDTIAQNYGMRVNNISVQNEDNSAGDRAVARKGQEFGTITLTFSVRADYPTFIQFLRDLESALRLVDVTAVSVDQTDQTLYSYTLTLKTYWLR